MKIRHSFTRVDTFASRCEKFYAFNELDPEEFKPSLPMRKGSQVHNMLEACALKYQNCEDWDRAAKHTAENLPPGPYGEDTLKDYLNRTLPFLRRCQEIHGVEQWFRSVCGISQFRGKLDLVATIGGAKTVIDYKTTASMVYAHDTRSAQHSLQLQIYCLATGLRRAGFVYLLPTGPAREVFVDFSEETLDLAGRRLRMNVDTIKRRWAQYEETKDMDVFAPAAGDYHGCSERRCPFWNKCLGKDDNG